MNFASLGTVVGLIILMAAAQYDPNQTICGYETVWLQLRLASFENKETESFIYGIDKISNQAVVIKQRVIQ